MIEIIGKAINDIAQEWPVLALSFLASVGALMAVIGAFPQAFIRTRPVTPEEERERRRFLLNLSAESSQQRLFGEAAYQLYRITGKQKEQEIAQKIDLIGYPKDLQSVSDFYYQKALYATVFFVGSGLIAIVLFLFNNMPPYVFVGVPLLTAFGYFIPDLNLNSEIAKRKQQMLFDLVEVLDYLKASYSVTGTLQAAIMDMLNDPFNKLGYLEREFAYAMERYREGMSFEDAIQLMYQRNRDIAPLARVLEAFMLSIKYGTPVSDALQVSIELANEALDNTLNAQIQSNLNAITFPAFLVLIGIAFFIFSLVFATFSEVPF